MRWPLRETRKEEVKPQITNLNEGVLNKFEA